MSDESRDKLPEVEEVDAVTTLGLDGLPVSEDQIQTEKPRPLREEELTYMSYLHVPELLELQEPRSRPEHHDEMLFIIIHQAYELWFKLILHELEKSIDHLRLDNSLRARHFINRCVQILKLLVQQIHILETMNPIEFLGFRDNLMPASGFQSLQFREVEFLAGLKERSFLKFFANRPEYVEKLEERLEGPDLRLELYEHLRRKGYALPDDCRIKTVKDDAPAHETILKTLREIYSEVEENLPVYLLLESSLELDQYLGHWRDHHVRVVERVIGAKRGTGGSSGVRYLRSTTSRRIFPYLWEVRSVLSWPKGPRPDGEPEE